jgi:hypothetical protein
MSAAKKIKTDVMQPAAPKAKVAVIDIFSIPTSSAKAKKSTFYFLKSILIAKDLQ